MGCITKLLESGADKVNGERSACVEGGGKYRGYEYLVTLTSLGYRCGYVAVPRGHHLHIDDDYSSIDLDMHGGCTFYDRQMTQSDCDDKWIGFDCAHSGDARDWEALKKRMPKAYEIYKKIEQGCPSFADNYGQVRSFTYVEDQCKNIIDQICDLDSAGEKQ